MACMIEIRFYAHDLLLPVGFTMIKLTCGAAGLAVSLTFMVRRLVMLFRVSVKFQGDEIRLGVTSNGGTEIFAEYVISSTHGYI